MSKELDSNLTSMHDVAAGLTPNLRALLALRLQKKSHDRSGSKSHAPSIQPVSRRAELPLSFAQQRLWFLDQMEPGSAIYLIPTLIYLRERLNVPALERTLSEIIRRHEVLRTTFQAVDGRPVQIINAPFVLSLPVIDLREVPATERQALADRLAAQEARRPFDLAKGPLLRSHLLWMDDEHHIILFTLHHIISDEWSAAIFVKEVETLYAAYSKGEESPLPELAIQYADFAHWQRQTVSDQVIAAHLHYWKQQLTGAPTLALPTDHRRPPVQSFRGARLSPLLPASLSVALKALAQEQQVTFFMLMLTTFVALLARYTGQEEVVVGTPIANRTRQELEGLIGFFVNTLVLRVAVKTNPPFLELLERVKAVSVGAYAHQDIPFEKVVEELQPQRDLSRHPLFQVAFTFQNNIKETRLRRRKVDPSESDNTPVKFDLTLSIMESNEGLLASFRYNTDIFEAKTIARMAEHYQMLLEGIVIDPSQRLFELPMLTSAERQQALYEWNSHAPDPDNSSERCIHELFAVQAMQTPLATAVVCEDRSLTYAELDQRANQLANYLRVLGVGPEVCVGLLLERSLDLVVAALAILKAGGAYVPLEPQSPRERLNYILADARVGVLVTQQSLSELVSVEAGCKIVCLDGEDREVIARQNIETAWSGAVAGNAAYVIYTSGSTGRPKGVLVTHANVSRLLAVAANHFSFTAADVWTLFHSVAFDFSVWEMWGALLSGGRLVVVPYWISRSPELFYDLLETERVTVLNQTPSAFRQLMRLDSTRTLFAGECLRGLRVVIFGGEALDVTSLRGWYVRHDDESPRLVNMYGITETTVHVTVRPLTAMDADGDGGSVIGRQLEDLQLYVLDPEEQQPVPVGVAGELYVGGAGLARGYLMRPELTAERFIPHPYSHQPGARLYRTGDLARFVSNGELEYLGRCDRQVKIRGHRIELGEIEAAFSEQAWVAECVVVAHGVNGDDQRLVAYAAAKAEAAEVPTVSEMRRQLNEKLPGYMVPSAIIILDALPLTTNGKVDRDTLPIPDESRPELAKAYVAASSAIEEVLVGIWEDLLAIERVGVDDNFFDLGGHSLLATQLISRVREVFLVETPLRMVFERPSVREMAEIIETLLKAGGGVPAPPLKAGARDADLPLSYAQQRLWFLDQLKPGSAVYNIPSAVRLRGSLDVSVLGQCLTEMVRRHEALRTTFAMHGENPVQVIAPVQPLSLPFIDLSELGEAEREKLSARLVHDESQRPFDLTHGPLLRVTLLRLSEEDHVVLFTLHHIVSDGWSMGVLTREVAALYEAFSARRASPLPALPVQYADYATWQRKWMQGEVLEEQLSYWKEQLAGAPAVLELPTDRARPTVQTHRGASHRILLSEKLSVDLRALGKREGATPFMVLLAAFNVYLHCCTNQCDIVVGTDIANRTRAQTDGLIGFFINQLVLRTDLSGDPEFRELLRRVFKTTLDAYAHQDAPFDLLVDTLKPERSLKHTPLFQVKFVLQNTPAEILELSGLSLSPMNDDGNISAKFDLTLLLSDRRDSISGHFEYNRDLFEAATIERMARQFELLLSAIVAAPETRLSALAQKVREAGDNEKALKKKASAKLNLQRLKTIRHKSGGSRPEVLIKTSQLHSGEMLPLVLEPGTEDVDLIDWTMSNRAFIETSLLQNGAILFRGFDISAAPQLEQFASLICSKLFNENGEHPRNAVSGNVYTPVFYPSDQRLLWHNENSFNYQWPAKIWFCCARPAERGGETPIVDSRRVHKLLDPEIKERFERKQIMYVRNYGGGLGLDWQTVFQTSDKAEVEERCRIAGMHFEWKNQNRLKTSCVRPASIRHPKTGEWSWFNQAQHWHISCLNADTRQSLEALYAGDDLPRNCYYGDGSPIEDSVMEAILKVYQDLEVVFSWQRSDILMLDNILTAHGRNAFVGRRELLVAMGEMLRYADLPQK